MLVSAALLALLTSQAPPSTATPATNPAAVAPAAKAEDCPCAERAAAKTDAEKAEETKKEEEKKEEKKEEEKQEGEGPSVTQISALVGSAGTVVTAVSGLVVAVVKMPNPLDYPRFQQEFSDAEAAFNKKPDAKHLDDANKARLQMRRIETGFQDQLGLIISASIAVATGTTGLIAACIDTFGGE
jgi:hypothetical protein